MKLTVLGSGNSDHHPERAGSGYLLTASYPILLDFGPGTWRNLARTGADPASIRLMLISHLHWDHFSDLVSLLFHQAWMPGGEDRVPLTIIGPPGTESTVETLRRTIPLMGSHKFPIDVRDVETGEIEIESVRLTPSPVPHIEDLTSLAWRVRHDGKTLAYTGDCSADESAKKALEGADLAIADASFPDDHPHPKHMTAGEACDIAREAGVRALILAHLSLLWEGRDPAAESADRFPGRLYAAQDLLTVEV